MKHILFLLLFLPVLAFAQFPANPNKIRLGNQTTADGLVVRTAASPSWTPSSINNAWLAFDTVAVKLYYYDGGAWNEYTGGSVNIGNTDLTLTGNRRLNTGGYQFWIQDGTGAEVPYIYIGGDQVSFAASTTTSVYLDSSEQRAAIVAGAVIDIDADSIRIIGTQPNDNSLNRLLAWDSITNRLHYVDKASITGTGGTDTNFATDNLTFSGNRVHNLSTRTLTIADGGTYPTFQQSAATDGFTLASSATDLIAQTPGLLQIENSDTITITADRIRMNAADTRVQQVSKDNALNRVMMIDSITERVYYRDVSSIAGGGGTVTGTGTTGTIPVWSSSTALGDSPLTVSSGSVTATGTGHFRIPNGTTAQRPGSPAAGMTRYNTTNGALEYYGASAWEVPAKSASATGLGTAGRVFYADANGRAAADDLLYWDATNNRLGIGGSPANALRVVGNSRFEDGFYLGAAGASSPYIFPITTSSGGLNTAGTNTSFYSYTGSAAATAGNWAFTGNANTQTSGAQIAINIALGFAPTSGTAEFSGLRVAGTINQTGGANGITRGVYVNPTLTAASNYRAFEFSNSTGWGIFGSGTARSVLGTLNTGSTTTNTTSILSTGWTSVRQINTWTTTGANFDVASILTQDLTGSGTIATKVLSSFGGGTLAAVSAQTVTNSATVYIAAPPAAGTNVTLTNANSLWVDAGNTRLDGSVSIGGAESPARTLHVTGEARITDLTTDTPTRIVGADADGDLGAITVGSGLSLSSGTLSATGGAGTVTSVGITAPAAGITVSGSPVTSSGSMTLALADDLAAVEGLSANGIATRTASNTWAARTITAGSGIAVTNGGGVSGNPTISRTYSLTHITISGGSTFFGTTAERPDNDTPGSATTSAVGSDFSVSGSTIDYTGGSGALIRVEGSISFSVADDGDYYLSLYKEGTEIGATSMRITCTAGNYYSVSLPATTVTGNTNDTFDLRIATVSGNSTTTMHRYGFILERIY